MRKALLAIEELPETANQPLILEGYDFREVQYHVGLLHEHALIRALKIGAIASYYPSGLTAIGHELADSIRDDVVWERIKQSCLKQTGSLTLQGIQVVTTAYIRTERNLMAATNVNSDVRRKLLEQLPEQVKT